MPALATRFSFTSANTGLPTAAGTLTASNYGGLAGAVGSVYPRCRWDAQAVARWHAQIRGDGNYILGSTGGASLGGVGFFAYILDAKPTNQYNSTELGGLINTANGQNWCVGLNKISNHLRAYFNSKTGGMDYVAISTDNIPLNKWIWFGLFFQINGTTNIKLQAFHKVLGGTFRASALATAGINGANLATLVKTFYGAFASGPGASLNALIYDPCLFTCDAPDTAFADVTDIPADHLLPVTTNQNYHIAATGNDDHDGSEAHPVQTTARMTPDILYGCCSSYAKNDGDTWYVHGVVESPLPVYGRFADPNAYPSLPEEAYAGWYPVTIVNGADCTLGVLNGKRYVTMSEITPAGEPYPHVYKFADPTANTYTRLFEGLALDGGLVHWMVVKASIAEVEATANGFYRHTDGYVYFRPSDDVLANHLYRQSYKHSGYSVNEDSDVGVGPWWSVRNIKVEGAPSAPGGGNGPGFSLTHAKNQIAAAIEIEIKNCYTLQTNYHSFQVTGLWPSGYTHTLTLTGMQNQVAPDMGAGKAVVHTTQAAAVLVDFSISTNKSFGSYSDPLGQTVDPRDGVKIDAALYSHGCPSGHSAFIINAHDFYTDGYAIASAAAGLSDGTAYTAVVLSNVRSGLGMAATQSANLVLAALGSISVSACNLHGGTLQTSGGFGAPAYSVAGTLVIGGGEATWPNGQGSAAITRTLQKKVGASWADLEGSSGMAVGSGTYRVRYVASEVTAYSNVVDSGAAHLDLALGENL